jgi:hypothetical protein
VDKKLKEFFIHSPLTLTNRLRFVTPHAFAAPQLPLWGKNTYKLLMFKIIYRIILQ